MKVVSLCCHDISTISTAILDIVVYSSDYFVLWFNLNEAPYFEFYFFLQKGYFILVIFHGAGHFTKWEPPVFQNMRKSRLLRPDRMRVLLVNQTLGFMSKNPITSHIQNPRILLTSKCSELGLRLVKQIPPIVAKSNIVWPYGCLRTSRYNGRYNKITSVTTSFMLRFLCYVKAINNSCVYTFLLVVLKQDSYVQWYLSEVGVDNPWMYDNYFPTWVRADSWLIGIWTGYYIANMGKKKLQLKQWQVVVGWTVAVVFGLMVQFYQYHTPATGTGNIMYEMVHRTIWALCLAWITIACYFGYGGIVNDFLSHPSWQPFSRLTYTMYLVAQEFTYSYVNASRTLFYFTNINKIIGN
ncbi:unnamed protein product, partial [Meganyctiphanes norvegica]